MKATSPLGFAPGTAWATYDATLDSIRTRSFGLKPVKVPAALYHYTSAGAARAIIESGCIWATDARFTNDPREWRFAWPFIRDALRRSDCPPVLQRTMLEELEAEEHAPRFQTYLASFSAKKDLLSQWRGYADDGAGCAVGIDVRKSVDLKGQGGPMIFRIEYGPHRLRRVANRFFARTFRARERFLFDFPRQQQFANGCVRLSTFVFSAMAASMFKQAAFSEEMEWRLFRISKEEKEEDLISTKFRETKFGTAPYVEIPVRHRRADGEPGRLMVRHVVLGPKLDSDAVAPSFRMLLAKHGGLSRASVLASEFEYR